MVLKRFLIWKGSSLCLLCWPFHYKRVSLFFVDSLTVISDSECLDTFEEFWSAWLQLCVCVCVLFPWWNCMLFYNHTAFAALTFLNSLVLLLHLPSVCASFGYLIYQDDAWSFLCRWYPDLSLSVNFSAAISKLSAWKPKIKD